MKWFSCGCKNAHETRVVVRSNSCLKETTAIGLGTGRYGARDAMGIGVSRGRAMLMCFDLSD